MIQEWQDTMARIVWVRSDGIWKLRTRARGRQVLARIFVNQHGFQVIVPGSEVAGEYGELAVAQQSAERRAFRKYGEFYGAG